MSLELISPIKGPIELNVRLRVMEHILDKGYKSAFIANDYCYYGFVNTGVEYKADVPPLFELTYDDGQINLSVYGNLNDLYNLQNLVTSIFAKENIDIDLQEE